MLACANEAERRSCIRCGYDLRATSCNDRCPECGAPVALSRASSLLEYASPHWVRLLRRGMTLKLAALAISALSAILIVVPVGGVPSNAAWSALVLLIQGVLCWGTILVTSPDPRDSLQEQVVELRVLIRWLAGMALLGRSLCEFPPATLNPSVRAGAATIVICVGTCAGVLELRYMARLAIRMPNSRLAGYAVRLSWAVAFGGAFTVILCVDALLGGTLARVALVRQVYGVLLTLFAVSYTALTVRYFVGFTKAAREAECREAASGCNPLMESRSG